MPTWRHTLAVANRRVTAQAVVAAVTKAAPVVAGVALFWVAVSAARNQPVNWPLIGGLAAAAVVVAGVIGALRRPKPLAVAVSLDKHAGLNDALSSALQLSGKPGLSPFEMQAVADADAAASSAAPSKAFPWRLRQPVISSALASAMLVGAVFIPPGWTTKAMQLAGFKKGPPKAEVQTALANTQAAEQLIQAVTPSATPARPDAPDGQAQRADPLADLRKQLEQGQVSPKDATQQAATAIERAADRLDQRAADAQAAQDLLRDRLAQAQKAKEDAAQTQPDSEFARALKSGDVEKAAAEAERLANTAENLSAPERARLAEELKQLARSVEAKPQSAEHATQAKESTPPQPSSADKPPVQPDAATPKPPSPQEKAEQQARELAEQLQKAADELKQPPSSNPDKQDSAAPAASDQPRSNESKPQQKPGATAADRPKPDQQKKNQPQDNQPSGSKPQQPEPQQQPEKQSGSQGQQDKQQPQGEQNPQSKQDQQAKQEQQSASKPEDKQSNPQPPQNTDPNQSPNQGDKQQGNQQQSRPNGDKQDTQQSKPNQNQPSQTPRDRQPGAQSPPSQQQRPGVGEQQDKKENGEQSGQQQNSPSSADKQGANQQQKNDSQQTPSADPASQPGAETQRPGTGDRQPDTQQQQRKPQPSGEQRQMPQQGEKQQPNTDPRSLESQQPKPGTQQSGEQPNEQQKHGGKPTDAPRPQPGDGRNSATPSLDQLKDKLNELANQGRQSQQDRQNAQKLREQAQKLWENATPEQRKQIEQVARELAKKNAAKPGQGDREKQDNQGGTSAERPTPDPSEKPSPRQMAGGGPSDSLNSRGPGDGPPGVKPPLQTAGNQPTTTHDLDARSRGDDQAPSRVIAEWLTSKPSPRSGAPAAVPPADVARAIEQQQKNAERALEQRTVPSRLTPLIRRYFDRLPQAVGAGEKGQPAPAQPAPAQPTVPPVKP